MYQVQNKPTAAYWISLIGGILGLLVSIYVIVVLGLIAYLTIDLSYYYSDVAGLFMGSYIAFGAWMLITSLLVIIFARRLNANPLQHKKYGILIIVFSIIGLGGLLGLIGGILALIYNPIPAGAPAYQQQQPYYNPPPQQPPPYQQTSYQAPPQVIVCQQCGTQMQNNVRFCPNCGRQQY